MGERVNTDALSREIQSALPHASLAVVDQIVAAVAEKLRDVDVPPQTITIGGDQYNLSGNFTDATITIGGAHIDIKVDLDALGARWRITGTDRDLCPYPGLAVFESENAAYFFGRDADITRLLQQTHRPIIAVTGPSGVGKSSFVLAGVLPRLRAQDATLTTVTFRISTSADLLRDLAVTLVSYTDQSAEEVLITLKAHDAALREFLLSLTPNGRVVLVLDQFEELFVGTDKTRTADRARLLDMLLDIERQADPRLLIMLTSRENYFEHPDYRARPDLRPIVQQRNIALDGLNDAQLREAILGPLEALNAQPERNNKPPIMFENGVIDLIEQEFRRTERTLPLVQYLLRLLWTEQCELSKSAYVTLGGLERALDRHASKIYESFNVEDQQLVRAVLLALVRPGIDNEYTRRRVPRDELIGAGAQHDRVRAVVGRLASQDSRIISDQQVGQTNYLELTHEILLQQWERLRLLIDTYRKRLELREQLLPLADQWHQSLARTNGKGDTAHLYRGSTLQQAKSYMTKNDLPEGVDTGIQACYHASQRHQRRQWFTVAIGTVVTATALVIGVNWFTADQRARLAAEQELSSQRATAQTQAEQTAEVEAAQRATADANAAQQAARAKREAEIANAQRLANLGRQTFAAGDRSLALALTLEATAIEDPPLQVQQTLAEISYASGFVADLGVGNAVSPNGKMVLHMQDDGRIILRDVTSGAIRELTTITASRRILLESHFSSDSTLVMVVIGINNPGDHSLRFTQVIAWETATGRKIADQSFRYDSCIIFDPKQLNLLVPSQEDSNSVELRDLVTGTVQLRINQSKVSLSGSGLFEDNCGVFNDDGTLVLMGKGRTIPGGGSEFVNGTAILWNIQTNTILARFTDISEGLVFISTEPPYDLIKVAYVRDDKTLVIAAVRRDSEPSEVATLSGVRGPLLWSSKFLTLVASSVEDNTLLLWSGEGEAKRQVGADKPLVFVDTEVGVFAQQGKNIRRLDLTNAAQMQGTMTSGDGLDFVGIHYIGVANNNNYVITNAQSSELQTYTYQSIANATQRNLGFSTTHPVVSADGSIALFSPFEFSEFSEPPPANLLLYHVIDMQNGTIRSEIRHKHTPGKEIDTDQARRMLPALNRDGSLALIAAPVGKNLSDIIVWNVTDTREERRLGSLIAGVRTLKLSSDGSRALVIVSQRPDDGFTPGTEPVQMIVWDTRSGQELFHTELGQDGAVLEAGIPQLVIDGGHVEPTGAAFSPDGSLIATTIANQELALWDSTTGAKRWSVKTSNEQVQFHPDGTQLLSASRFGNVEMFTVDTGVIRYVLPEALGPAAFSLDGRLLVTSDSNQQARVWDTASGSELRRFPILNNVIALEIAHDGKSFFTGSANGLKQWRLDTFDELVAWTRANRAITELSCEQRMRYQVLPLCDATGAAPTTVLPEQRRTSTTATPTARPNATATSTTNPRPATPTIPPPTAVQGIIYRTIPTSDGFVTVRERPTRNSRELQRLTTNTEVVCTEIVVGEVIEGSSSWAYCPAVNGYIFRPLLTP
jgi:WD40 repeat protein